MLAGTTEYGRRLTWKIAMLAAAIQASLAQTSTSSTTTKTSTMFLLRAWQKKTSMDIRLRIYAAQKYGGPLLEDIDTLLSPELMQDFPESQPRISLRQFFGTSGSGNDMANRVYKHHTKKCAQKNHLPVCLKHVPACNTLGEWHQDPCMQAFP